MHGMKTSNNYSLTCGGDDGGGFLGDDAKIVVLENSIVKRIL
jgi:hypothetical protein